jgi:hypothetical protein
MPARPAAGVGLCYSVAPRGRLRCRGAGLERSWRETTCRGRAVGGAERLGEAARFFGGLTRSVLGIVEASGEGGSGTPCAMDTGSR